MLIPSLNLTANQIFTALALLALPGAVWLAFTRRGGTLPVRLADAVGLSISFNALAWLLSYFLKFDFTFATLHWVIIFLFSLLIIGWIYHLIRFKPRFSPASVLAALAALIILALGVWWRIEQAKTLIFPAWVDSVHHSLIVRVLQEQGHLVGTLRPYMAVPFAYHYSFHALTAMAATLTGLNPSDSILWFGQVINALIGLSVYRLAIALWADWRKGLLTALLVTFALHLPAYYLTWGRYTLSIGLVMLPLAMASLIDTLRKPTLVRWIELLVLTAGVVLSHLTALLLIGVFAFFALLVHMLQRSSLSSPATQPWQKWGPLLAVALAILNALALTSPWLYRLWGVYSMQARISTIPFTDSSQVSYLQYIWTLLGPNSSYFWLILGACGLLWSFFHRKNLSFSLWGLVITLLMVPWGLRLGSFRPDHMAIILFLPISLFAADFIYRMFDQAVVLRKPALIITAQLLLLLAVAAGLVRGTMDNRDVINPTTIIADDKDRAVLDWIRENTSVDSKFLINTAFWMGNSFRGVDGGYWLLPYASRETVLPPVFYTFDSTENQQQVNDWAKDISTAATCDDAFNQVLARSQPDYIYIRTGKGSLQPAALDQCRNLLSIYRQHDVVIYQVLPDPSSP